MFKSSVKRKKKTTAQAMVEFALALPVLLLVVYGLIEAGRLLFIYASVVTAARQAVRYGSATGTNAAGTPYYQDCAGITAAANSVAFITQFSNIQISYDAGLDSSGNPIQFTGSQAGNASCSQGSSPTNPQNGWRIKVQVSAQYAPIVPLVPFKPFTITSMSSRTLLADVSISVTQPPGSFVGTGVVLTVSPNTTTYSSAGQQITFTYNITNNGSVNITSYSISDSKASGFTCSPSTLAANGGTAVCTGTYYITQADMDSGSVLAIASVTGLSNIVNTTLLAIQNPLLSLTKTPSTSSSSTVGAVVTYTYTLKNTGNVTLTSPFAVSDNKVASVDCSAIGSSLAPQATGTCTGSYSITQSDVNAGSVTNTATATAMFGTTQVQSASASATVITKQLFLAITATPLTVTGINQVITYTYTLKNTGTTSLSSFSVTDSKVTNVNCSGATSPLPAGQSTTCTGTYTTTQADIDAGVINSQATASAQSANGPVTSNQATASIVVSQTPAITLTVSASPTLATTVGQTVTYTYTLQNSGNVTLSTFSVNDNVVTPVTCSSTPSTLAPGATATALCSGTYTIKQSDIDAGSVIDQATATGKTPTGQSITSAPAGVTVITYNSPRLTLKKAANPTTVTAVGQSVTYTYTLWNTGNTPLTSPYTVTDNKVSSVDCSAAVSPLAVGATTTCTGTYIITQTDANAGAVTNTATATAKAGSQTLTSNQATATVTISLPVTCTPLHSALSTSPFSMAIYNASPSTMITITQIQIFYNSSSPGGQFINILTLAGSTIWSGTSSGSPATFTAFSGNVSITAGNSAALVVSFSKSYKTNGTERILVTFAQNGCPILDSSDSTQLKQ